MSPGRLKLKVLHIAAAEIKEQANFYRERSGAPLAARWRTAVNEAMRSLRSLPERGGLVILRIIHGARDLPPLLESGPTK